MIKFLALVIIQIISLIAIVIILAAYQEISDKYNDLFIHQVMLEKQIDSLEIIAGDAQVAIDNNNNYTLLQNRLSELEKQVETIEISQKEYKRNHESIVNEELASLNHNIDSLKEFFIHQDSIKSQKLKQQVDSLKEMVTNDNKNDIYSQFIQQRDSLTQLLLHSRSKPKGIKTKVQNIPNRKEVITMTASELYQEYERNDVAAKLKYQNPPIIVSGRIKDISTGSWGIMIYLKARNYHSIHCRLPLSETDKVAQLEKGRLIKIKGSYDGYAAMIDCELVE